MTWQQASYDSTFSADDFVFADGRRMDLLLAYGTLGVSAPDKGNAVLLLHDTVGGGQQLLQPAFCRRDVRRGRNAGSVRACGGNLADGDGVGGGGHRIGWPTRIGLAPSTVQRIWKAFSLQPHRSETSKPSTDPLFVDKVGDIVGLSLNPPDRAVMLCVEES